MHWMNDAPRTRLAALAAICLAATTFPPAAMADDPAPADGQWRGTGGAALSASSGNTRSQALQLKFDMARLTEADKISLGGSANYARSRVEGVDSTTANRLSAFGQYDHNLGPRLLVFGRLDLDRDELTDLDLRTAVGAGLGWKLIDRADTRFTVFGGVSHTVDRYDGVQVIDGRSGDRFSRTSVLLAEESAHALSSTVSFKQRLSVSPGFTGDKGTLAELSADLAVALNSSMSLSVGVVNRYDSQAPDGRKRNDLSLFTGLNVKFGAL